MQNTARFSEFGHLSTFCVKGFKVNAFRIITQPAITCSKLTIETLQQSVKYV